MPLLCGLIVCFLSGLTDVKILDIQVVEIFAILLLPFIFLPRNFKIDASRIVIDFIPKVLWLLFFMLVGSLLSLRLTFYPPGDYGILKTPPYASFVRLFEIMVAISCLFVVALAAQGKANKLDKLLFAFVLGGIINSIWAITSWIAWQSGVELGGAYEFGILRMRGFFAEGGPLGVYLVGAILVQLTRYFYFRTASKRTLIIFCGVMVVALVGSQSKAGILLCAGLAIYYLYLMKRIGVVFCAFAILVPVAAATDVYEGLSGYYENIERFEAAARERPDDVSLVMGRVMGSVLLPRIVEAHPLLGVGIGNYSLVRNDPEILQGLPRVRGWDLHGLGLLGYAAELGIPLTLYLLWLYAYPMRVAPKQSGWLRLLGAYALMAALFGVQINFAYPWIIAGFALAAVAVEKRALRLRQLASLTPATQGGMAIAAEGRQARLTTFVPRSRRPQRRPASR